MAQSTIMDGSTLKAFVENEKTWSKFVDEKFAALDKSHTGTLTHVELQPAIAGIGSALGLPPMGESPETDHIYDEMFSEFGHGMGDGVTKQEFSTVMRDILLGLGDGLERDPVSIGVLDGTGLQNYVQSPQFEIDTAATFVQLDSQSTGTLKASTIKEAMRRISVAQGMPPPMDPSVSGKIEQAFKLVGINGEESLDQNKYIHLYRKVVLAVATSMKEKPMTVAHSDKKFDGSSITELLQKKPALDAALEQAWLMMPKTGGGAPKSYLRVGLDTLAPIAGLPPIGAIEEMNTVVNEAFKVADADAGGVVSREQFNKSMLEVLGSIMLQLQGKPIGIQSSAVVADSSQLGTTMPF